MTAASARGERLRVLIVAHAFPPMNSIASHRPYSWARAWRDAGHEIHVLTPAKYGFDGSMDLERDLDGIEIHEVAYLPLGRARAKAARQETPAHVGRWESLKAVTRRLRFGLGMFADLRLLAYWPMVRRGLHLIHERRFDFIIATSPPENAFVVARTLSRRTATPWVADFRDAWFHDLRLHHIRSVSWLSAGVHRRVVAGAVALVTVSRGLQRRLADALSREVLLAYNGFFASDQDSAAPKRPWNDGKVHVCYTGRVYPGKQDPRPLFRALTSLRTSRADLANRLCVDFYGFDGPALEPIIREHGVEDCVAVRGFVPYRESINIQRAADALLFLDWIDDRGEGMLTGKLMEYLGSGRPVLALGTRNDSEAAKLISEARAGKTLTHEKEIESYLESLLASPRTPTVVDAGRDTFSREHQAQALLDQIRSRLPQRK